MILSNFCKIILFKMFVVFEIYELKNLLFWPLKIPYYVTHDLNFDMMRLRWSRATVPLLTLITNYKQVKIYV